MEHVHPLPAEPQSESREGQGQGKETPDCSKDKGPYLSGFTYRYREGWGLDYAKEAIKLDGKIINTSCQFTYSFFFNLFLYFISLQIPSVCLTYILYIFIYQYNASL